MKILMVGCWHSKIHEEPLARELRELGAEVDEFRWFRYFQKTKETGRLKSYWLRFQDKYLIGPEISKLNRDLIVQVANSRPETIFLYRGTHVRPATLKKIKENSPGIRIISYNNDNPFAKQQRRLLWRHHLKSLVLCDHVLAYRPQNIGEYEALTDAPVGMFLPFFDPEIHSPPTSRSVDDIDYDCIFIGHYEPDFRLECIRKLVESGVRVGLFGDPEWNEPLQRIGLKNMTPVQSVWSSDYTRLLQRSLSALCFFSKLNEDVYTRRCFEIPATGTLLCSEYSKELSEFYAEGREALFFRDADDLPALITALQKDPQRAFELGSAGREAVVRNKGSIKDRAEQLLAIAVGLKP